MTATLSFKYFDDIEGCAWQDVVVGDDYAHVLHIAVSAFDPFQYRTFQYRLADVKMALVYKFSYQLNL